VVGASEHAEEGGDVGEVDEHGNLEEDIGGEELKKEHCGCVDLMGWADGGSCVRWMEVLGTIGDENDAYAISYKILGWPLTFEPRPFYQPTNAFSDVSHSPTHFPFSFGGFIRVQFRGIQVIS
jgi:hypothetical protein